MADQASIDATLTQAERAAPFNLSDDFETVSGPTRLALDIEEDGTNAISELAIGIRMSDFRVIRKAEPGSTYTAAFTPADARARHEKAVAYIFDEAKKHRRVVVMTHHAPSYMSAFGHASDKLTPACCSNLDEQILDHPQIELWVHGHTHQSERYMIGKTKVLANQCGYPHERCSTQFKVKDGEFELNTAEAVT